MSQLIKAEREAKEKVRTATGMDGHSQGQDAPIKPNSIKNYYPVIRKKDADDINESIAKMMAVCGKKLLSPLCAPRFAYVTADFAARCLKVLRDGGEGTYLPVL